MCICEETCLWAESSWGGAWLFYTPCVFATGGMGDAAEDFCRWLLRSLVRHEFYHSSLPRVSLRENWLRCAMRRRGLSVWVRLYILFVCVSSKNTAVCCLTARKSPRNSSLPLGLAIYILRKMPRKPDESSVECYGHGFLIAARPRGV